MTETPPPRSPERLPDVIPILPLFDAVLFPGMVLPLVVVEPSSVRLVDEAMAAKRIVGLVVVRKRLEEQASADPEAGKPGPEEMAGVGTSATILKMARTEDHRTRILVQGVTRFRITAFVEDKPYLQARSTPLTDIVRQDTATAALKANLLNLFEKIVELTPGRPREIVAMAKSLQDPGLLADMVTSTIDATVAERQEVLELPDVKKRLKAVTRIATRQVEILELGRKIQQQVTGDMERGQREYYLRRQLEAIKEELGEKDERQVEVEDYRARLEAAAPPAEAAKEAERELNRLARMSPSSAEYTVAATYLDWIVSLPWHAKTEDRLDIDLARRVLDEDHHGLEKPKKRIIEYLAVRKLKPDSKGPILCFAGPPGTGKTSLGRSIARTLGRKFHRISLGGVRDEAEIRGHRRTYVGALPGRIIQGLRRTESKNPVFMLDEIDKVGHDFRGDPSSALLEVLDPEQNHAFSDHYLDVAFDLSEVMFITTANVLDTIPPALRDRMEVLELAGYTEDEKILIAKRFLVPRQREAHGLEAARIRFTVGALRRIIGGYTREAGLRDLERAIATVCRGVATRMVGGETGAVKIGGRDLHAWLGPEKFVPEAAERTPTPGVATGLAWTPAGGSLLFIEATAMKGDRRLTLTGQLGDVMKESATTALSFIRANARSLGLREDFFDNRELHVHVPAGAVPKDGPSAGVTLLTALVSLLTGRKVKKNLAMTGEITLRGQVLPVGGVKEKVLAAHRAGIREIVLPAPNKKDLDDVPETVHDRIAFHLVNGMRDVLRIALEV